MQSMITLRPATMDDIEPVLVAIHECELADERRIRSPKSLLEASWSLPSFDLDRDSMAAFDQAGRCLGIAAVFDDQPDHSAATVYLNVVPDARGNDILHQLIAFSDGRLADMEAAAPLGVLPIAYLVRTPKGWPLDAALHDAGWEELRWVWTMERPLTGPLPHPSWPTGISARIGTEADIRVAYQLDQEAFQDHHDFTPTPFEEWRLMVAGMNMPPDLWVLAFDGGTLVGSSLCSDTLAEAADLGYVGNLAVRRSHRRRGLGLALLHESFRLLAARGRQRVQLSVDSENLTGATRLYERAGMHVTREHKVLAKTLR